MLPSRRLVRPQLMMTLLYVERHIWRSACVAKPTCSASSADDDFVVCRNARVEKCLCCQADV